MLRRMGLSSAAALGVAYGASAGSTVPRCSSSSKNEEENRKANSSSNGYNGIHHRTLRHQYRNDWDLAFNEIDTNHDGTLDRDEIRDYLLKKGVHISGKLIYIYILFTTAPWKETTIKQPTTNNQQPTNNNQPTNQRKNKKMLGAESVVGISNCSLPFWFLTASTIALLAGVSISFGRTLSSAHTEKLSVGYCFVEGDIQWEGRNLYLYPFFSAFAGLFGGLLGIGGGMIMGPLLLELGMLPEASAATSATTVLITSGAATFQFLALGMLLADYSAYVALLGLVATYIGQRCVNYFVRKNNSSSLIVFSIAAVMVIAVVLMTVAGIIRINADIEAGTMGFSDLC